MPILGGIGNISEYAYRSNAEFRPCPYSFLDLLEINPNTTYYSTGIGGTFFQVVECLTTSVPIKLSTTINRRWYSDTLALSRTEIADTNLLNSLTGIGYTVEYSTFASVFANDNRFSASFADDFGSIPFYSFADDLPIADRFSANDSRIKPSGTFVIKLAIPEEDQFDSLDFSLDETFDSILSKFSQNKKSKILEDISANNNVYLTDGRVLPVPVTTSPGDRPIIWGYEFNSTLSIGGFSSDWNVSVRWPDVEPDVTFAFNPVSNHVIYYYSDPNRGIDENDGDIVSNEISIRGLENSYFIPGGYTNRLGADTWVDGNPTPFEDYGGIIIDGTEFSSASISPDNPFNNPNDIASSTYAIWENGSLISLTAKNEDFVERKQSTGLPSVGYENTLNITLENYPFSYRWLGPSPSGFTSIWSVETEPLDLTPSFLVFEDFTNTRVAFTPIANVALDSTFFTGDALVGVTTEALKITGLNVGLQTSAVLTTSALNQQSAYQVYRNGEILSNYDADKTNILVRNDDFISLRTKTGTQNLTINLATIKVGNTSTEWRLTTVAAAAP